ncbi:hypothetical protein LCGC14_0770810, partial [marine sediment metagenome]
ATLDTTNGPIRQDDGTGNPSAVQYRYSILLAGTSNTSETVTLKFKADQISYIKDVTPALTVAGVNGGVLGSHSNDVSYVDVLIAPASGDTVPDFAATGDIAKLSLTVNGQPGPAVTSLLNMGNGVTRIFLLGTAPVGDAVLTIAENAFGSTGAQNRALTLGFKLAGAQGVVINPGPDGSIGIGTLNGRGYVDLSFDRPLKGLRIGSITDLAPEFEFKGTNVKIAFDDTQAPEWLNPDDPTVDPDTITENYRFRYWTKGTFTSGTTIERIASFEGEATVLLSDGTSANTNGVVGFDALKLDTSWIDVRFTPTWGDQIDFATLGDEIAVTGATLSGDAMRIGDGLTVRYFLTGAVNAGRVTVQVLAGTYGSGTNAGEAADYRFDVLQLSGALADPVAGGVIGKTELNNRGYIDVSFVKPSYAFGIDVASVTDLAPEVVFSAIGGTIKADDTQAPVYLGMVGDAAVFRVWYSGDFQGSAVAGNVTVDFIGGSFNWLDASGNTIDAVAQTNSVQLQVKSDGAATPAYFVTLQLGTSALLDTASIQNDSFTITRADGTSLTVTGNTARAPPGQIELAISAPSGSDPIAAGEFVTLSYDASAWKYGAAAIEIQQSQTLSITTALTNGYIDVSFATLGLVTADPSFALDMSTLTGDEVSLGGAGASVTVLNIAPTDLGNGTFRYYTQGAYTKGDVLITFKEASWSDKAGNTGGQSVQSFKVIDRIESALTPVATAPSTSRIFFIEIAGGIRYNVPGISDPMLEERGKARLTFGTYADPDRGDVFRFTLKFSGTAKVYKLGNVGSIAGSFVIEDGGDTGRPEFWGVAAVQTNFGALAAMGLHINGSAVLQINLSSQARTESISLEGLAGDKLGITIAADNVAALGLDSTTGLFQENAVTQAIRNEFIARSVTLAQDATIAVTQNISNFTQWRITSGGKTYFAELSDGKVTLSSETRTYVLPAGSFAFEVTGSVKLTIPGGNPDTDALAEMSGGFYISITKERAEVFAIASVVVGPASAPVIEGRAQGLFIVNYSGTNNGIAGSLSLERKIGSPAAEGAQDDGGDSFAGIAASVFKLDVTISLQFNTTLAEQRFTVPSSFLELLPPDASANVIITAGVPSPGDPTAAPAAPSVYFLAFLKGSVTLFDAVTLNGSLTLAVSITPVYSAADGNGDKTLLRTVSDVRLTGVVNGKIDYVGVVRGDLDLLFSTTVEADGTVTEVGLVGRAELSLVGGLAIPNVQLDGGATLSLEINTFDNQRSLQTFLDAGEFAKAQNSANQHYTNPQYDTDGTTPIRDGANYFGTINLNPGLTLYIEAGMSISNVVSLRGVFELKILKLPEGLLISAELNVQASLVGILDNLTLEGKVVISEGGMVIYGRIAIDAGMNGVLEFKGSAVFELNTFSATKVITVGGTNRSVASGVMLTIQGSVEFVGFATASGKTTIAILSDRTVITFDIVFGLGGLNARAAGAAGLYYTGNRVTGIALALYVSIDANIAQIIDISASGKLTLNTTNSVQRIGSFTLEARSFTLALNGNVQFLKTIKFNTAFNVIIVADSWEVNFRASINFFGIATLGADGVFRSDGTFNVSLRGGVLLGSRGFGMEGSFNFNVFYDYVGVGNVLTIGFSGNASVKLYGLGINWGGASIGFSANIPVGQGGRVPIKVSASASIKIVFVRIRLNLNFTIGYLELPKPIKLAEKQGSDLVLNMGNSGSNGLYNNSDRGIGEGADDETYFIEQIAPGTIKVIYSGREQIFTGVDRIVGFGGDGNDMIVVREGVDAGLLFDGGNGADIIDYQGSGQAFINTREGATDLGDQITIGRFAAAGSQVYGANVTSPVGTDQVPSQLGDRITSYSNQQITIKGMGGDDFIQQAGAGAATIYGGDGADIIFGGPNNDIIFGGNGVDEIDGGEGSDTIDGGADADLIFRALNAAGILTVNGTGSADTLYVTGSSKADTARLSKGSVVIRNADNTRGATVKGGVGTVQIQLLGGNDTVIIDDISGQGVNRLIIEDDLAVEGPGYIGTSASREGTTDNNADTVIINGTALNDIFTLSQDTVDASDVKVDAVWNGQTAVAIVLNDFRRAAGDRLIINAGNGADVINASAITQNTVALELAGEGGRDTIVGSQYDDILNGGLGDDTITGGEGYDTFVDAGNDAIGDTLIESFNGYDFGIFEDRFVVGNASGATDDIWSSATLENINGIFENVILTGGNNVANRMVVNDLDRQIRVNGTVISVAAFDGTVTLDAKSTGTPEVYVINAPKGSGFVVNINDTGSGAATVRFEGSDDSDVIVVNDDQLVVTGAAIATITHVGTDRVELNTAGGGDVITVQSTDIPLYIRSGLGDDTITIGNNGSLTEIDALVDVDAFDVFGAGSAPVDRGSDTLLIDGRNDSGALNGTIGLVDLAQLEGRVAVNGFALSPAGITYIAVENIEIDLGNGNNIATIISTGLADKTTLRTLGGADQVNLWAMNGPTFIETGAGVDTVTIGKPISTTPDSEFTVNDVLFGLLTIDGGSEASGVTEGNDILRVSDNGDTAADRGNRLTENEIVGLGMTVGIKYTSFETLILETSDANNELHIAGTHAGLTRVDMGDEATSPSNDAVNDVLNIERLGGAVVIKLGQGNDVVRVNYDEYGKQTFTNGLQSGSLDVTYVLELDGEQGSDFYQIGLSGEGTALIRILDSGIAGRCTGCCGRVAA